MANQIFLRTIIQRVRSTNTNIRFLLIRKKVHIRSSASFNSDVLYLGLHQIFEALTTCPTAILPSARTCLAVSSKKIRCIVERLQELLRESGNEVGYLNLTKHVSCDIVGEFGWFSAFSNRLHLKVLHIPSNMKAAP